MTVYPVNPRSSAVGTAGNGNAAVDASEKPAARDRSTST